jgi:hypothetical protein
MPWVPGRVSGMCSRSQTCLHLVPIAPVEAGTWCGMPCGVACGRARMCKTGVHAHGRTHAASMSVVDGHASTMETMKVGVVG